MPIALLAEALATVPEEAPARTLAAVPAAAERTALAAATFRVAVAETGAPSEVAPEDTTDRARGAVAVVAPPASDLEGEEEDLVAAAAEDSVAEAGAAGS